MTGPMSGPRLRIGPIAVFLTVTLIVAACSDGDGESATTDPSSTPTSIESEEIEGGTEVEGGEETDVVSGWDIDAALAANPNCAAPVTGDPLRIGYAADLSPIGGPADAPGSQAAQHMAKLINCSGGIDGKPVEVIVSDVSGDPLATRDATNGLLANDVHVLLGPPFPDPGFRILQVTRGQYPVIFTGSTEPALGDHTALSYLVAFNDTQGATVAAQFALSSGWSRAVTFSSQGPYFGYNSLVFQQVFEETGGEIIGDYEFVPFETTDFAEAVAQIAADPPDVIYTPMFAFQLVELRQQLEAAGVTVEYLQSDAFEATGGYGLANTDGIYHVTHAFPSEGSRIDVLNASLAASEGVPSEAPSMVALAGDAMAVIADAYLRVRTTDPVILGNAIADANDVQGVTGVLSYNGTGSPTKEIYIHEVVDGSPSLAATVGG
ncbi:MAG: ABC transporter substrate-binding protein [Actinomycetota bacterium]